LNSQIAAMQLKDSAANVHRVASRGRFDMSQEYRCFGCLQWVLDPKSDDRSADKARFDRLLSQTKPLGRKLRCASLD
jgi:hypothetical protein